MSVVAGAVGLCPLPSWLHGWEVLPCNPGCVRVCDPRPLPTSPLCPGCAHPRNAHCCGLPWGMDAVAGWCLCVRVCAGGTRGRWSVCARAVSAPTLPLLPWEVLGEPNVCPYRPLAVLAATRTHGTQPVMLCPVRCRGGWLAVWVWVVCGEAVSLQ